MKMIVVVALALVAAAAAAPVDEKRVPAIVRYEHVPNPDGSYTLVYETENGIVFQEKGELKTVTGEDNKPVTILVKTGAYSYTDKDGNVESIKYKADENGTEAEGPSIPQVSARR